MMAHTQSPTRKGVSPSELESQRPPTNLYSPEFPHTVTVRSVDRITKLTAQAQKTYHVVFDHQGFLPHWEGQRFGVMPVPDNPFELRKDKKLEVFSVASTRYGDFCDGKTASLCVRSVPGTISEAICASSPGAKFQLTGPIGEAMLLGDYGTDTTHIFVATGTAIAPFRAHLLRFFNEDIPNFNFRGVAWLFVGVANHDSLLYEDDLQYLRRNRDNFRYYVQNNSDSTNGEDVSREVIKHVEDIFSCLQSGAYIYFAGIRGMEIPVKEALEAFAKEKGLPWPEVFGEWEKKSQWRVEVHEQPPFVTGG